MAFRDALNRNPAITTGATAGIIVVALGFIVWSTFGGRGSGGGYDPRGKAFFTADEGATFIVDSADKRYAPPKIDGKDALYAHVFTCDDGPKFVGYVERLSAEAAKALAGEKDSSTDSSKDSSAPAKTPSLEMVIANGREVRRPRETEWIKANSAEGAAIIEVKCPDGTRYATEVNAEE